MRLEAYMELAMTIHRYTTVSTDSKKTFNSFLSAISACNSNHLHGECEVEGRRGPLFNP